MIPALGVSKRPPHYPDAMGVDARPPRYPQSRGVDGAWSTWGQNAAGRGVDVLLGWLTGKTGQAPPPPMVVQVPVAVPAPAPAPTGMAAVPGWVWLAGGGALLLLAFRGARR